MKLLFPIMLLLLSACSSTNIDNYETTQPALDLRTFLQGDLVAYGMLQDRSGRMTRRFVATLNGSWSGERGTLVEQFRFDDGEVQDRTWIITHLGDGRYIGTAGDVVGEAEGEIAGSVFQWQYQLDVPWNDGTIVVDLDDWLYLVDERHVINKTTLTKFGFRVGELTLVIEKAG
ncbi:MAG: DUF3833 domain-containing protein [Pseudomonadota bacterium]